MEYLQRYRRRHSQQKQRSDGDPACIETLGGEALGIETLGKEGLGIETLGKEALGIETLGKEALGTENIGKEALGIETLGIYVLDTDRGTSRDIKEALGWAPVTSGQNHRQNRAIHDVPSSGQDLPDAASIYHHPDQRCIDILSPTATGMACFSGKRMTAGCGAVVFIARRLGEHFFCNPVPAPMLQRYDSR
ncbi:unnamed protein product [Boreogadus saida]